MKTTFKSVAVALCVLAAVIMTLTVADNYLAKTTSNSQTYLKVTAVDLAGQPVHNAKVTVCGSTFNTDNKGLSPAMELTNLTNAYDNEITDWHTVTVVVQKENYVSAVVFNCVVYYGQTRKLTVKLYPKDASDLPYTVYVESPPDAYVKKLVGSSPSWLANRNPPRNV